MYKQLISEWKEFAAKAGAIIELPLLKDGIILHLSFPREGLSLSITGKDLWPNNINNPYFHTHQMKSLIFTSAVISAFGSNFYSVNIYKLSKWQRFWSVFHKRKVLKIGNEYLFIDVCEVEESKLLPLLEELLLLAPLNYMRANGSELTIQLQKLLHTRDALNEFSAVVQKLAKLAQAK